MRLRWASRAGRRSCRSARPCLNSASNLAESRALAFSMKPAGGSQSLEESIVKRFLISVWGFACGRVSAWIDEKEATSRDSRELI